MTENIQEFYYLIIYVQRSAHIVLLDIFVKACGTDFQYTEGNRCIINLYDVCKPDRLILKVIVRI